jgi:hypothetical protein
MAKRFIDLNVNDAYATVLVTEYPCGNNEDMKKNPLVKNADLKVSTRKYLMSFI